MAGQSATSKARPDYAIHLNFLAVNLPPIQVYGRLRTDSAECRPFEGCSAHRLPLHLPAGDWQSYWISMEPRQGFDPFKVEPGWNADLTRRALMSALKRSVQEVLSPADYLLPENNFILECSLVMKRHPEGQELLVVQPYTLKAAQQSGFLVDFHFRLAHDVKFSRKIQQLSLSLDKNFRRNVDYYADRDSKVRQFLKDRWQVFETLRASGTDHPLQVSREFSPLPAERLQSKLYVFANAKESKSQFTGLREFGPLKPLDAPPRLLFAFREQDRQAARHLAATLKGSKQRGHYNFPGFSELFKTSLEIDPEPIVLPDLTTQAMEMALGKAKDAHRTKPTLLPVLVLPPGDDNGYLAQKAHFSHAGMPTQVCTLRILEDEDSLKWAIGNLALQIFCKAGGQPWKVRPTAERSLIVGVSQSHKIRVVNDRPHVDKYFAFSVLTDSSGLFQQIKVLGESTDHAAYVSELCGNLRKVLMESAAAFDRVVLHTSFKLKYAEIEAIQRTTREVAGLTDRSKCRFSAIKVNHKSRFFGTNRAVNSLVPYEATQVRLARHEYLIWFDGIYPDKPNVHKAFAGPTHLEFLNVNEHGIEPAEERELLQDIVNLSGANWRGFNAKSAPVSVFYCHLVADLVHSFHHQGLPLPAVNDLRPWFL